MGEKQKKAILTLFFPGEYRFSGKSKPGPYEKDYMKKERKSRGKEQIPLLVKIDSQDSRKKTGDKFECEWEDVRSVFTSCGITDEKLKDKKFCYQTFYPPYCVSIVNKIDFNNIKAAEKYLGEMYREYQKNNPELRIEKKSQIKKN